MFDIETKRARELFDRVPLEVTSTGDLASEVHLAISGQGAFEQAAAVQAALIGHYPDNGKIHLWLDSEAHALLLKSVPGIVHCVNLRQFGTDEINSVTDLLCEIPERAALTVLATDTSPQKGMQQARQYRESWQSRQPQPTLKVILSGSLPKKAKMPAWVDHLEPIESFTSTRDKRITDKLDAVAKKIHHTWYTENTSQIEAAETENAKAALSSKPTYKPWDQLTPDQQDCNRAAADHITVKIRAVGLDPKQSDLLKAWQNLTEAQLDMLARVEHQRWAAPLWINGYTQGARDDAHHTHPNLVPYDALDQGTQDYDTAQVIAAAAHYVAATVEDNSSGSNNS